MNECNCSSMYRAAKHRIGTYKVGFCTNAVFHKIFSWIFGVFENCPNFTIHPEDCGL